MVYCGRAGCRWKRQARPSRNPNPDKAPTYAIYIPNDDALHKIVRGDAMSRGYVYILVNEAMPGLAKIGKTTRSVEQRAAELHQTGVPFPFEIFHSVLSPNCHELESWMHNEIAECRVNDQREFFLIDLKQAVRTLNNFHVEQVSLWVEEFTPGHSIEESDMMIDTSFPLIMSDHLQIPAEDVVSAYEYLLPEDMHAAVKRMIDDRKGIKKMDWLRSLPFSPEVYK